MKIYYVGLSSRKQEKRKKKKKKNPYFPGNPNEAYFIYLALFAAVVDELIAVAVSSPGEQQQQQRWRWCNEL